MKRKLIFISLLTMLSLIWFTLPNSAQSSGHVLVLTAEGPVSPIMLNYIERGIERAEIENAAALVIQLDTPGGQIDLTREIIQAILNANVPVIVYVYPPGGFAASAGTFITLAGHVAAMAPQTSIGAASPVTSEGGEIGETMKAKVENILIADIENLTERRGEGVVEWATEAITEAKAANASEALELGIIDFVANDLADLLAQVDGFEVSVRGEAKTLQTTNAPVVPFDLTAVEAILSIVLQPEIAFLILGIGWLALFFELSNPGGYISGVIGVICLIIGFYAVGQLPINYAGVALIILAFILFAGEAFAPTHGALTLAGVISMAVGGLFLFDESSLGYEISAAPIIATSLLFGAIFFFIMVKALGSLRLKPASGMESMVGTTAVAKTALNPSGTVFADGTRWQATLEEGSVETGEAVEITAVQGLKLKVRRRY